MNQINANKVQIVLYHFDERSKWQEGGKKDLSGEIAKQKNFQQHFQKGENTKSQ